MMDDGNHFQVGDEVRINIGPFKDFEGVISEIDIDRSVIRVLVSFFDRETPVELNFQDVKKI